MQTTTEVLKITPAGEVFVCGRPITLTLDEQLAVALLCRRMNPAANPEET